MDPSLTFMDAISPVKWKLEVVSAQKSSLCNYYGVTTGSVEWKSCSKSKAPKSMICSSNHFSFNWYFCVGSYDTLLDNCWLVCNNSDLWVTGRLVPLYHCFFAKACKWLQLYLISQGVSSLPSFEFLHVQLPALILKSKLWFFSTSVWFRSSNLMLWLQGCHVAHEGW